MKFQKAPWIFCLVLIAGCSAALVPYTSDPGKKIDQAYALTSEGRAIPAERLGKEALAEFERKQNVFGQAEAHHFLGAFYKSAAYREYKKYFSEYAGAYDPTQKTSRIHFEKAAMLFRQDGDLWGESKSLFEVANTYQVDGDSNTACMFYNRALRSYESKENVFKGRIHTQNPNFKDMAEMIRAFMKRYSCNEGTAHNWLLQPTAISGG